MHPFNTHHQESVSDLTWDEFLEDSPIDLSPSIEDLIKDYELQVQYGESILHDQVYLRRVNR